MAAVVWAGQTSVGFWFLSCTFVFQSAAVPGLSVSRETRELTLVSQLYK